MIRRIVKHGEPVLKSPALPLSFDEAHPELPGLLRDMWATLRAANGVGLAAPQIGLSLRVAVVDVKVEDRSDPLVLINPEIVGREGELVEEEGCLSLPGLYAKVRRHARVRLRALDGNGRPWERTGAGLLARVFEHEVDHLDGKLFIDRLDLVGRLRAAALIRDLRRTWK